MTDSIVQTLQEIATKQAGVQTAVDNITSELAKGKITETEYLKKFSEFAAKNEALQARITELEQKAVSGFQVGTVEPKTLGEVFSVSEQFKNFAEGKTSKSKLETKNSIITPTDVRITTQIGGMPSPMYRNASVLDLISVIPNAGSAIEYVREGVDSAFEADQVADNVLLPETDIDIKTISDVMYNIGHHVFVSKNALMDAPQISGYIDGRLTFGAMRKVKAAIVAGTGSGQMRGMLAANNSLTFVPTQGATAIDSISTARNTIEAAGYEVTGVLMNPSDWSAIEISKTNGEYVLNPFGMLVRTLWGLPVVTDASVTPGKFVMATFSSAYEFHVNPGSIVESTESHDDMFLRNMVTLKLNVRGALATYMPYTVLTGSLVA
jgi:HK97 family phage major capsid protein